MTTKVTSANITQTTIDSFGGGLIELSQHIYKVSAGASYETIKFIISELEIDKIIKIKESFKILESKVVGENIEIMVGIV